MRRKYMNTSSKNQCLLKRVEKQELTAREFGFYWEHFNQLIEQIKNETLEVEGASKDDRMCKKKSGPYKLP